ncbi:hypothetical protein ScPMuIL_016770 [Solemya velum]
MDSNDSSENDNSDTSFSRTLQNEVESNTESDKLILSNINCSESVQRRVQTKRRVKKMPNESHQKGERALYDEKLSDVESCSATTSPEIEQNDSDATIGSSKDEEELEFEQSDTEEIVEISSIVLKRLASKGITGNKDDGYTCPICARVFRHAGAVTKHIRTHTGDKPFECHFCGKAFTQSNNCIEHERIHTGERPFSCEFCGKSFAQSRQLTSHVRTHTVCNKSFSQKSHLDKHGKIHTREIDGERIPCEICGDEFLMRRALNRHLKTHVKELTCKKCGTVFTKVTGYKQHVSDGCTGVKPYTCGICDIGFPLRYRLIKHMRRAHTGERPCECDICGKHYTDKKDLYAHKQTHKTTYKHSCFVCHKGFHQVGNMNRHLRGHSIEIFPKEKLLIELKQTDESSWNVSKQVANNIKEAIRLMDSGCLKTDKPKQMIENDSDSSGMEEEENCTE